MNTKKTEPRQKHIFVCCLIGVDSQRQWCEKENFSRSCPACHGDHIPRISPNNISFIRTSYLFACKTQTGRLKKGKKMKKDITVLIKGAGEMASGIAWRLHQCHFKVAMTEVARPIAVRRAVSFCEVIYDGRKEVEGVEAILATGIEEIRKSWENQQLPVIVDPEMKIKEKLNPDVLLEATLSKHNTGVSMTDAPLVIALGPGYDAGRDAHYVVETNRGHHLGRLFTEGPAEPNTGVPGEMGGVTYERVLRAPTEGIFETWHEIGDRVKKGKALAKVGDEPVIAKVDGILRGLIRPGISVKKGLKIGDIDPRANSGYVHTISEKARAVCGAVLEAILRTYNI